MSTVPGIVIHHSPASTKRYVGCPSIVVLPTGEYVASHSYFGPGATKESVKAMSNVDFYSYLLRVVMAKAAQLGQIDFRKVEVLGSVPEGDSLRHVVTRTHVGLGEITMEAMEVISFKKMGDKWGILLQGKIKGMAQQFKKALESKQQ